MNRSKQRQQQRRLLLRHIVASHCERQADRARRAGTAADASSFHHPSPPRTRNNPVRGATRFEYRCTPVAPPQCPTPTEPSPPLFCCLVVFRVCYWNMLPNIFEK